MQLSPRRRVPIQDTSSPQPEMPSRTGLRGLERPVEAAAVAAGIRVRVEERIGRHGVGKDRRPIRRGEVRGGLDHQRAGLQHIVHAYNLESRWPAFQ